MKGNPDKCHFTTNHKDQIEIKIGSEALRSNTNIQHTC